MAKFCYKCGSPMKDGATFCGMCGSMVIPEGNSAQPAPQPESQPQPEPEYQQPAQPEYQQPAQPQYQQPAQPQYQQPVQPQYQQPVQPQYQQPVQPQYQQPVPPQYQQPVPPQYQQPYPTMSQQLAQQAYMTQYAPGAAVPLKPKRYIFLRILLIIACIVMLFIGWKYGLPNVRTALLEPSFFKPVTYEDEDEPEPDYSWLTPSDTERDPNEEREAGHETYEWIHSES